MSEINKNELYNSHYEYMLYALLPLVVCSCFIYGKRVLLIVAVAMITARAVDVLVYTIRKKELDVSDKSSTVRALTFAMMLPVSVPLYIVVMAVALTILMGKHAFGGRNVYPFSLAALAMCIAAVNWPREIFKAVKPFTRVSFWSGECRATITGAAQIKNGYLPYVSMLDLLLGNHASSMGTAFILIILAVGISLIATKKITWHIPVTFVATCAAWALAFPRIYGVSRLYSLRLELLSSAIIFYAVYMLSEPATTPQNPKAKIVFGFITGVLTMFFRYYGSYEIGACFAILIVNATESFWDRLFEGTTAIKQLFSKPAEDKKQYKAPAPQPVKQRPVIAKPVDEDMSATQAFDIIAHAEDSIDEVEFSTRTIDVARALKEFEEKYGREGR